jgi:hypothetical protein
MAEIFQFLIMEKVYVSLIIIQAPLFSKIMEASKNSHAAEFQEDRKDPKKYRPINLQSAIKESSERIFCVCSVFSLRDEQQIFQLFPSSRMWCNMVLWTG